MVCGALEAHNVLKAPMDPETPKVPEALEDLKYPKAHTAPGAPQASSRPVGLVVLESFVFGTIFHDGIRVTL